MKSDCVIHLGVAKTGTTLFQQALFTDQSIFLPLGRYGVGGDTCIDDVVRDLVWEGLLLGQYHWEKRQDLYRDVISNYLSKARKAGKVPVLSNEGLAIANTGQSDLKDRFERLAALFSANATCLILIREQFSWLKSMYSSLVCDGGASLSLQRFFDIQIHDPFNSMNYVASVDFDWLFRLASKYFDQVAIIPFEAVFSAQGTDTSLISKALGIESFDLPEQKVNVSHSLEHIARARALNTRFPRGVSKPDEDVPNIFQRSVFRNALAKAQKQRTLSEFEVWMVNKTIAERKQQMLTLHDTKGLQNICEILQISPLSNGNKALDLHHQWCKQTFAASNRRLAERIGIDLAQYGYY